MKKRLEDKTGVALIIVLGLVAVLLLVCVSFSISMRVERAGASRLRHAAMARQLVNGAMATALAALDEEVGYDLYPRWQSTNDVSSPVYTRGDLTYWGETFVSTNTGREHITARFFSPEVEKYFPSGTAFKGYATNYIADRPTYVKEPEWIPVHGDISAGASSLLGRYAYFIMNTSDMLDLSVVNHTNRWMGYDPQEIQIAQELFPEIRNYNALMANLANHGRYDSLAEFKALNEPAAINDNRSFTTFSYEPENAGKVMIGGSADDIKANTVEKIVNAFKQSGLDDEQAKWAYLGLIDYVDNIDEDEDEGYLMERDFGIEPWERPATEPMPLMSGFVANIIFEKREIPVEAADSDPADPTGASDTEHWEIRVSAEIKIPFVFPFSTTLAQALQDVDYELDGKARLALPGGDFVDGLINYRTIAHNTVNSDNASDEIGFVELPDDCYINGLSIRGEWVKVTNDEEVKERDSCKYIKDEKCFPRGDFFIQAAGSTSIEGEPQRRFPLDQEDYDAEGGDISDGWMTAHLNTATDVSIDFSNRETTSFSGVVQLENDEGDMVDVTVEDLKYWRTNIVVWAEFVDPRFSCKEMYGSWSDNLKFYRASHIGEEFNDSTEHLHYKFGSTELPQSEWNGHFNNQPFKRLISWANNNENLKKSFGYSNTVQGGNDCEKEDVEWSHEEKPGGWMDHDDYPWPGEGHPSYFQTTVTAGRNGASPFASYLITNPDIVTEVYQMNMDGVRIGDDESESTTDSAKKKWRMHVKNAPLESVGELGYLPIGIWHTVRLYDYGNVVNFDFNEQESEIQTMTKYNHIPCDIRVNSETPFGQVPFHTVLDKFIVNRLGACGRVNLNSGKEATVGTVFGKMPLNTEKYDDEQLRSVMGDDAGTLAFALIDYRSRFAGGSYTNLSQLGYIFNVGEDEEKNVFHLNGSVDPLSFAAEAVGNSVGGDFGEWEREAVIRNSCGLFTTRGQTFIIAACGESYSPVFGKTSVEGGAVNGSKTAIAQVWRDTVPENLDEVEEYIRNHSRELDNEEKRNEYRKKHYRYPKTIQFFKIIDD